MEKVYKIQSYLVKFDMGNPVEININVYHENQTELSRKEIIEEALSYAEEVLINIGEDDLFEIVTLQKEE